MGIAGFYSYITKNRRQVLLPPPTLLAGENKFDVSLLGEKDAFGGGGVVGLLPSALSSKNPYLDNP